jgi:hypothetical protein
VRSQPDPFRNSARDLIKVIASLGSAAVVGLGSSLDWTHMSRRYPGPSLPMKCSVCQVGTVRPCTDPADPKVVGCCDNPTCGHKVTVS